MWPFSSSNPGLEFGGFFGMGKMQMYEQLPPESYPRTVLVLPADSIQSIKGKLMQPGLTFPFVAKPEAGMQGLLFRVIKNERDLEKYHRTVQVPWLAQEYIAYKKEFGVFYLRYPNQERGRIVGDVPAARIELGRVGDQSVHFVHRADRRAVDLSRAARHHQPRRRMIAPRTSDRLTGLAQRLTGDRAGIDDDKVGLPRQHRAHPLAFRDIHATAERDDVGRVHA